MPDTQCRVCGVIYGNIRNRRVHELTIHRLHIMDGDFYSTTPYVIPLAASSAQIQSSPQTQSSSALQTTTGSPAPQTPSVPPAPMMQSASPAPMSMGSTGNSPSAPTLFVTPSPATRPLSTSVSPASRNMRPRPPSRSPSPALIGGQRRPRASNDPGNRKCHFCLHEYSSHAELNRHLRDRRCLFEFRPDHVLANFSVLRRPPNYSQTSDILSQLTISDKIKMCRLNNWAIPKVWPLVFPGQIRRGSVLPLILTEMTAARESVNILRELLRTEPQISLPKQIIIIDEAENIQSVLPTRVLTPGTAFLSRISGDHILVSSGTTFRLLHINSNSSIF